MAKKSKDNKEQETILFNVKKLSPHPISMITTTVLFVALIGIISSNLVFIKTIRGSLTLQQTITSIYYYEFIDIYPTLILNIACISAILSNLSKRLRTISKIGYLINTIISILLFFNLYSNNLRVGIAYYLIILVNTILLLLPIKYHIVEEEIEIDRQKESIYQNKNNKIEELHNKPTIIKQKTFISISIIIIELISIIIILTKNNNDIYKETIIQANSDFQIEVINDYINIRSSSNIESEVLGTVNKGDIYNVLDISNTENHIWYKINYKGKKGYIASPKQAPYIKELFNNKLVVNVFCTKDNQDCGYLMEFLVKYQRSTAKAFLIKYQDLEDEYTKDIYIQVLKHFDIEESIPLLIIGDNKIVNYTKKSETTIIEVIQEQMENDTNIVTELKKGNKPAKKDS